MSDIVERARRGEDDVDHANANALLWECADEIERLTAALRKIAGHTNCEWGPYCKDLARAALEGK